MTVFQEVKSANQWTMTTESILPLTDWHYPTDSGGVVRFDDGTVWVFMLGMYSSAEGYSSGPYQWKKARHLVVFEQREGFGWEMLMGSNFANTDIPKTSGTFLEDLMTCEGDITLYTDSKNTVYLHNDTYSLVEIDKDARTWFTHTIPSNLYPGEGNGYAHDDDFLYWWSSPAGSEDTTLCRMSRVSPYGMEAYDTISSTTSFIAGGGSRYDIGSNGVSEGLNYIFKSDKRISLLVDGYIYIMEGDYGDLGVTGPDEYGVYSPAVDLTGTYKPAPTNGYSGVRRYHIATKTVELLYHSRVLREFNLVNENGVYDRELNLGPFPFITGFFPAFIFPPMLKDGWLYYIDASGSGPYQRTWFIWWAGWAVRRINLDYLLTNKPVKHSEYEPIVETLTNGTAPNETWATYFYETGARYSHWRGGDKPLHSIPLGNMWFMEDDGAIVFLSNEVSEYVTAYTDAAWPLQRLSPPSGNTINVSLVFEGNAMKGYVNIHGQPSKACPEIVNLT